MQLLNAKFQGIGWWFIFLSESCCPNFSKFIKTSTFSLSFAIFLRTTKNEFLHRVTVPWFWLLTLDKTYSQTTSGSRNSSQWCTQGRARPGLFSCLAGVPPVTPTIPANHLGTQELKPGVYTLQSHLCFQGPPLRGPSIAVDLRLPLLSPQPWTAMD